MRLPLLLSNPEFQALLKNVGGDFREKHLNLALRKNTYHCLDSDVCQETSGDKDQTPVYCLKKFTAVIGDATQETQFEFLGAGAFTLVYHYENDKKERFVCRISRLCEFEPEDALDRSTLPHRVTRLTNSINATACAVESAVTYDNKTYPCVMMPFIEEDIAEKEAADFIIDCYLKTRRILIDGYVLDNFKKLPNDELFCVDASFAIRLSDDLEKSQDSLDFWGEMQSQYDTSFLMKADASEKNCFTVIRALLTIEMLGLYAEAKKMPLKNDVALIQAFSSCYANKIDLSDADVIKALREKLTAYRQFVPFLQEKVMATNSLDGLLSPADRMSSPGMTATPATSRNTQFFSPPPSDANEAGATPLPPEWLTSPVQRTAAGL